MSLSALLTTVSEDEAAARCIPEMMDPGAGTLVLPGGMRPAVVALAVRERRQKHGEEEAKAGHSLPAPSPIVVVTASTRHAKHLGEVLPSWGVDAVIFPAWETLPHERLSPQVDTMARRAAVLRRLAHPETGRPDAGVPEVLVVPIRAFLQPVITSAAHIEPLSVSVGSMVDPHLFAEALVDLGYEAVPLVQARGQVAVRGSIVDVFVPTDRHPIRIELFGDEVDDIRFFNLSDQRTVGIAEDGFRAGPARELLLTPEVAARALELQQTLPGAAEMLELAAEGIYAPGLESLAPSLVDEMGAFTDFLGDGTLFLADELERIRIRAADLEQTSEEFLEAAWDLAAGGGKIPLIAREASFLDFDEIWGETKGDAWWDLTELPPLALAEKLAEASAETAAEAHVGAPNGALVDDADFSGGAGFADAASTLEETMADQSTVRLGSRSPAGSPIHALVVSPRLGRMGARDVEPYRGNLEVATEDIRELSRDGWRLVVSVPNQGAGRRMVQVLGEHDVPATLVDDLWKADHAVIAVTPTSTRTGFVLYDQKLALLTEADLTGRARPGTQRARKTGAKRRKGVDPLTLNPGDYVVHVDQGIGKFLRIETRKSGPIGAQVDRDFLAIEYQSARKGQPPDLLFVPTSSLDQVSAYAGSDKPRLSKMGGADWAKTKQKARAAVREIAEELVRLYAERSKAKGYAFSPDTPWQRELEDSFEFTETPDQLSTMEEVKADMEKQAPMDRLLTGDVGYGKTEIALRAAFKAIQDGKQVAVLVPTTLLAQQHYETFVERYAGFPVEVAQLSRFTSKKEADVIKKGLADGKIDVVIGTHTLLTGTVQFKDLGLIVVDEEQRFGVQHKETLKALRTNVDVLSMSATPIPRTLEMAVSGIREMSVLQTPPEDRQPVLTFVGQHSDAQVAAAIRREILRDGQVFYVHNRVESIDKVAAHLKELVPEARIRVAHGKLSEAQLEQVIVDFWNGEFDVLVSTTIVETGLDISNANTLIVDRSDAFGLSQLHQLRGRVGRGGERAYAYFLYPRDKVLSETSLERLRTIAAHTDLGAGLAVAQKDLEIRGAGNLLGAAQSGQIEGVGFDLYVRMVSEAVAAYKGEEIPDLGDIRVELPVDAHLPETYVPSEKLRLEVYGKIAAITDEKSEADVRDELADRFGPLPREVELLMAVARLREDLRHMGITEVFTAGNFLRIGPVVLPESKALRLQRLYPGTRIQPAVRQVMVPLVPGGRLGAEAPKDEEMLTWVRQLLKVVVGAIK